MKFTLTYQGPLAPTQRAVSREKRALREAFMPQLIGQLERAGISWPKWGSHDEAIHRTFLGGLAHDAIVTRHLRNAVDLDILLLTPAHLTKPGDADNRVKTLLDGLTRPRTAAIKDVQRGTPVLALLEDDFLVERYSVEQRTWLGQDVQSRDSLAILSVRITSGDGPGTIGGSFFAG